MNECGHYLGDDSTLMVAADGCSLECEVCHEIVLQVELTVVVDEDDIEWLE
jgi:pyruvate-formate lyase-activating enzyme